MITCEARTCVLRYWALREADLAVSRSRTLWRYPRRDVEVVVPGLSAFRGTPCFRQRYTLLITPCDHPLFSLFVGHDPLLFHVGSSSNYGMCMHVEEEKRTCSNAYSSCMKSRLRDIHVCVRRCFGHDLFAVSQPSTCVRIYVHNVHVVVKSLVRCIASQSFDFSISMLCYALYPMQNMRSFQEERNTVCQALCKVHGVGSKTALAWYKQGIRSVQEAQQRVTSGEL